MDDGGCNDIDKCDKYTRSLFIYIFGDYMLSIGRKPESTFTIQLDQSIFNILTNCKFTDSDLPNFSNFDIFGNSTV